MLENALEKNKICGKISHPWAKDLSLARIAKKEMKDIVRIDELA